MYMYNSFLIHLSADGHIGCFHVLSIVKRAVMNIGIHVSLSILVSLVCMLSSGIVGSYGSYISRFFVVVVPFFKFYFILLYNAVLVLPYINMNPPRVYMSSQS